MLEPRHRAAGIETRPSQSRIMSFLLRAALVIGALSYFAAIREQPRGPSVESHRGVGVPSATLSGAWDALPVEAPTQAASESPAERARQAAQAQLRSRDTLAEADRRPAWRGGEDR